MTVGERVKILLEKKGMTAKGLSEISGVPINTIYAITKKNGAKTARVKTLEKLADALGTNVDYLLGKTEAAGKQSGTGNDDAFGDRSGESEDNAGMTNDSVDPFLEWAASTKELYGPVVVESTFSDATKTYEITVSSRDTGKSYTMNLVLENATMDNAFEIAGKEAKDFILSSAAKVSE